MADVTLSARDQGTRDQLSKRVLDICAYRHLYLACAESLTGGLLADSFVRVPGASQVFLGSEVTYDIRLKASLLGVSHKLLDESGAVNPRVVEQMAQGVSSRFSSIVHQSVLGLSTTGIAGPGGEDGKPVGLVYIGLAMGDTVRHRQLNLVGSRQEIRERSVLEALRLAEAFLMETSSSYSVGSHLG